MTKRNLVEAAKELLNANLATKQAQGEKFGAGKTPESYASQPAGKEKAGATGHGDFVGGPVIDPAKAGQAAFVAKAPTASPPGTSPEANSKAPPQTVKANHGPDGQHRASATEDGVVHEDKDENGNPVKEGVKTDTTHETRTLGPQGEGNNVTATSDIDTAKPVSDRVKEYFRSKGAALAVSEDVNAIFNGQEFSEDFKSRAKLVFEAAVITVATKLVEGIEADYIVALEKVNESLRDQMASKLDEALTYMTEQWLKENHVAVEKSLRADLTESFIEGLQKLLADHYIDVPEEKVDVIDEMAGKIEELESKLNESVQREIDLTNRVVAGEKTKIVESVVAGLTDVQASKIKGLAENVKWTNVGEYTKSVELLRETYFPKDKVKTASTEALNENTAREKADQKEAPVLVEDTTAIKLDPKMARYVAALAGDK